MEKNNLVGPSAAWGLLPIALLLALLLARIFGTESEAGGRCEQIWVKCPQIGSGIFPYELTEAEIEAGFPFLGATIQATNLGQKFRVATVVSYRTFYGEDPCYSTVGRAYRRGCNGATAEVVWTLEPLP